jgi:hypothetical protein
VKKIIAFSYARCSTPKQQNEHSGKSIDRQIADAQKYAELKGYALSSENIIAEIMSSYGGRNIGEEGALGAFVERAKDGKLSGSVLILEDLDRFSRTNPTVATQVFLELVNQGVTIVTLGEPPKEYNKEILNGQGGMSDLITTVLEFFRSNGESRRKRGYATKKWSKRRERAAEGTAFKMKHPGWVRFIQTEKKEAYGHYVEIKERADVLRRIYSMFLDGKSIYNICKILNKTDETGVKTFSGRGWSNGLVKHYLKTRAVLGEYQPNKIIAGKRIAEGDAIKNFFPKIIEQDQFDRVQARWKTVPTRNGRPPVDESTEILFGLIRCPYCSRSIGVQEARYQHIMACNGSYDNACVRIGISRHFIEWSAAASTEEIFNSISLSENNTQKIQALEGRLVAIRNKKRNLVDLVADGIVEAKAKVMLLEDESRRISTELEQERNMELANEEEGDRFVEAFVTNSMDKGIRMKAMLHIRRFIAKVEPFFLGDLGNYSSYRKEMDSAESSGLKRNKLWAIYRKKFKVRERQFIRITFTRPINGLTGREISYQHYLDQMEICGVKVRANY